MSMFSNRFLWKASVYIAVGGMTSVMIMRSMIKGKIKILLKVSKKGFKNLIN